MVLSKALGKSGHGDCWDFDDGTWYWWSGEVLQVWQKTWQTHKDHAKQRAYGKVNNTSEKKDGAVHAGRRQPKER